MVHCVAFGCSNTSDKGKGFFIFPKDPVYRKKWVEAVGSNRLIDGKIVPFSPSSASRLCVRHFGDDSFVHPPSVMNSVGVLFKLSLVKNAVPTKFPETEVFRKTPDFTETFGPPKTKRKTHGAYEKRNRKQVVDKLIEEQNILEAQKAAAEQRKSDELQQLQELEVHYQETRTQTPPPYDISAIVINPVSTRVSRGSQTIETMLKKPTADKSSQARPTTTDTGMTAIPQTICTLAGPDSTMPEPVEKGNQFPDPDNRPSACDEDDLEYKDDSDLDPDWEPDEHDTTDSEEDVPVEDDFWDRQVGGDEPDVINERKYVVFDSCLRSLFLFCTICAGVCSSVKRKVIGSMLSVETVCEAGHRRLWNSQPVVSNTPLGNLLVSGAIMFSGASPTKALNMFKFLNVLMIAPRTYSRFQRSFILPAIANVWDRTQKQILKDCRDRPVKVAGDARCCSPGHTAKYGSYTLMDAESGLILAVELVQSNEVKNSNAMELEGLKRAFKKVEENKVAITDITTDRHGQVKKYLREETKVNHWFDGWHLSKNIKKKLLGLSKKKDCEVVGQWVQSISNHLYFCAATSAGNGDEVEQKWMSILNHITNKHDGHGDLFPHCLHGPIERNWILAGSKAHKELKLLLGNKRLLTDIRKLSPAEQTSQLESQHKVVCQFAPKFVSFSYPGMKQRLNLAALHTCCNAYRAQAVKKDGTLMFKLSYPKYKAGHHVLKVVKESCSYEYVDALLDEMLSLRKQHKSHKAAQESARYHLQAPPPVCSMAIRVSKEDAIRRHISRFGHKASRSAYLNPV